MNFETIAGVRIFLPCETAEAAMRREAEAYMRSQIAPGCYNEISTITRVINAQVAFYRSKLSDYLPALSSQFYLRFLLHMYDQATVIERLHKGQILGSTQEARWAAHGPVFRRAIKFLAECCLASGIANENSIHPKVFVEYAEIAQICAEEIVRLCMGSDTSYMLFPKSSEFSLFEQGADNYWSLDIIDAARKSKLNGWQKRVSFDRENRSCYLPKPTFDLDAKSHAKHLDDAFLNSHGWSYRQAVKLFGSIIQDVRQNHLDFPVFQGGKSDFIAKLASAHAMNPDHVSSILNGFTITSSGIVSEGGRQFWNGKKEHRAYRRPIFEFVDEQGESHLAFSKEMAEESFLPFVGGMPFGKIPSEWHTDTIKAAIGRLSVDQGKWFENQVSHCLRSVGIIGRSFKGVIGTGNAQCAIPSDVGEIDFLGYEHSQALLVILECKMVEPSAESRFWRTDITNFLDRTNNYVEKFRRKIKWVQTNHVSIAKGMESTGAFSTCVEPKQLGLSMITMYPAPASLFMDDLECKTVPEFMHEYKQQGRWPYQLSALEMELH